jgi:hypothetical protein
MAQFETNRGDASSSISCLGAPSSSENAAQYNGGYVEGDANQSLDEVHEAVGLRNARVSRNQLLWSHWRILDLRRCAMILMIGR